MGHPDPHVSEMPHLFQVLKGIKIAQLKQRAHSCPRLTITPTILRQLKRVWDTSAEEHDTILLWAASTTCFFGFLRVGEMTVPSRHTYDPSTHLAFDDFTLDSPITPSVMKIQLKTSKPDPFRKGIFIFVSRTNNNLCPITTMLAFIVRRGERSRPTFSLELAMCGFDQSKYCGHSFRIGAATTAVLQGIPDSTIRFWGGRKAPPTNYMFKHYGRRSRVSRLPFPTQCHNRPINI